MLERNRKMEHEVKRPKCVKKVIIPVIGGNSGSSRFLCERTDYHLPHQTNLFFELLINSFLSYS